MDSVPVVNEEGYLMGEYSRRDSFNYIQRNAPYLSWIKETPYARKKILLDVPTKREKQKNLAFFAECLSKVLPYTLWRGDMDAVTSGSMVLFVDEDEKACSTIRQKGLKKTVSWFTYEEFLNVLRILHMRKSFADSMDGIKVYTFLFDMKSADIRDTDYIVKFRETMVERSKLCNSKRNLPGKEFVIPPELKEGFLDDLYTEEYWKEFKSRIYHQYKVNGISFLKDVKSRYVNISGGYRHTLYDPGKHDRNIFFFGRCVFIGTRVEDKNTIPSVVQKKCNQAGYSCRALNRAVSADGAGQIWKIVNTVFHEGDVAVIHDLPVPGAENINGAKIVQEKSMPLAWFTDNMAHANHHALNAYAHAIFDRIRKDLDAPIPEEKREILPRSEYIKRYYIDTFFSGQDFSKFHAIGSIVMNCNPFTKGHRYLIERAREQVDFLIIFVVEEDQSYFDFDDRFAMVKKGTEDMDGVMVVPSGDFILSANTFPEYFIKIADQDIIRNVEYDIALFAEAIAKPLGINFRFVGEELSDPVTAEYNKAMHRILPGFGIRVVELPRICGNGTVISASTARKYMEESRLHADLHDLLPTSTMQYLGISEGEKSVKDSLIIDILPTKAQMTRSSGSVMQCIDSFEGGAENIYMMDDAGRYGWQALRRKDFSLSPNADGKWAMHLSPLPPIVFPFPFDWEDSEKLELRLVAEEAFAMNPGSTELPVVGNDGRILAVARIRGDVEQQSSLDWEKVAKVRHGLPKGKIFVSSVEHTEMKAMAKALKGSVEVLREVTLGAVLAGKAEGTLVYGKDFYPGIRKISVWELHRCLLEGARFEENRTALRSCEGFHGDFGKVPETEGEMPKAEPRVKEFLAQVEQELPILLEDAYDIEEVAWMCARLRESDRFGSDNHLYLQYSSWPDFLKSMELLDWREIANSGKAVFLFGEEDLRTYYPSNVVQGKSMPLQIDEIVEIVDSIPMSFSGANFLNMILDSHPSLLTIGWNGLPTFTSLWKVFCEGKVAGEAVEHLKQPKGEAELRLRNANLFHALKYKYEERLQPLLDGLLQFLAPDKQYSMRDWFKSFYLSCNAVVGRKFTQRIAPAVFYDEHGVNQGQVERDFGITGKQRAEMKKVLLAGFPYKRCIGIIRAPLSKLGCQQNSLIRAGKLTGWRNSPLGALKAYASGGSYGKYWEKSDTMLPISRQVRFEDLKIYPRETTEKLCEFLRIPWSESCLHITTNGEDSGMVHGTAGFDVTPVYTTHPEYLSTLDYYRIELLNVKNYNVCGYRPKYYDGTKYTAEEIRHLFSIPFKVETQKLEKWPGWPDAEVCKEFHQWILQRALEVMEHGEKDHSIGKDGNPLHLVECIFPDLEPGQRLFTC